LQGDFIMPSVYALGDPRTSEIRYIGIAEDAYQRYASHLNNPRTNSMNLWIKELKNAGLAPILTVIESNVDKRVIFNRETHWIRHHLALGANLINIVVETSAIASSNEPFNVPIRTTRVRLNIKEIAQQKNISLRRLAIYSGIDINRVRTLIREPFSNATTDTLGKLANVLGVDASELIKSVEDE
jgi:DNA-binding Xre family transcriptional regulator